MRKTPLMLMAMLLAVLTTAVAADLTTDFPKATQAYAQFGMKVYDEQSFNAKFPKQPDSYHLNYLFATMLKPGTQFTRKNVFGYNISDRIAVTQIYSQELCFGTAFHVSHMPVGFVKPGETYPGRVKYRSQTSTKETGIRMNQKQAYNKYVELWTPNLQAWERLLSGNSSPVRPV